MEDLITGTTVTTMVFDIMLVVRIFVVEMIYWVTYGTCDYGVDIQGIARNSRSSHRLVPSFPLLDAGDGDEDTCDGDEDQWMGRRMRMLTYLT